MAARRRPAITAIDQPLPWPEEGVVETAPAPAPPPEPTAPAPSAPRRRQAPRPGLTAEQRVLRARVAAYRLHATHDPKETTAKARAAFAARFERQVDPEGRLAPAERARRAEAARRAYFTALALRSSQARRRSA